MVYEKLWLLVDPVVPKHPKLTETVNYTTIKYIYLFIYLIVV